MTKRILKRATNAAVAVTIAAAVVACAPEAPDPEPSYLTFASEEEAYAAAEEVYRAYVDAVNRGLQDPEDNTTLEYLAGIAYESKIDSNQRRSEEGQVIGGSVEIISATGVSASTDAEIPRVELAVCEDVRNYVLLDAETGKDITPETRPDVVGMLLTLVSDGQALKIVQFDDPLEGQCSE